ncbi:hypothetical protein bAD24_p01695 (plasmid) [Burkholderia sp. AD24]|nr:hypothetical protein bAD24_p01695 [Burkholderia sp. AD24]
MSRNAADSLVLPVRIALEQIRQGTANRDVLVRMAEVALMTAFLTGKGFSRLDMDALDEVGAGLLTALEQSRDDDGTHLTEELVTSLVYVVNEFDRLVHETRLQAIVQASESCVRLNRATTSA